MISHNVYFWLKPELTEEQKEAFKGFFEELRPIPTINELKVGIPAGTENRDVVENSFTYSLQVTFNNMDAHNTYQDHEYHIKAVETYSEYWDRVLVHDFKLL